MAAVQRKKTHKEVESCSIIVGWGDCLLWTWNFHSATSATMGHLAESIKAVPLRPCLGQTVPQLFYNWYQTITPGTLNLYTSCWSQGHWRWSINTLWVEIYFMLLQVTRKGIFQLWCGFFLFFLFFFAICLQWRLVLKKMLHFGVDNILILFSAVSKSLLLHEVNNAAVSEESISAV